MNPYYPNLKWFTITDDLVYNLMFKVASMKAHAKKKMAGGGRD